MDAVRSKDVVTCEDTIHIGILIEQLAYDLGIIKIQILPLRNLVDLVLNPSFLTFLYEGEGPGIT